MCKTLLKRLIDIWVSSLGLLTLSPLFFFLMALIYLTIGPPVFFSQLRPGYKDQLFKLYKFRTMKESYDDVGIYLPDAERLTWLGQLLRSMSIDELPELINVLKGEMSLVGPRPLLVEYLDRYSTEQHRRHEIKPGLTGWAQVNGRNAISWEEKFRLDVWYVDNWSLILDLKIILLTIIKVLKREGINADGQATMMEFMGNKNLNKNS